MPSHVSHADNFLEAAHCVSQTGRMLLPSEYIYWCWGCRWCSRCSQHQHRVPVGCQKSQHIELRISTGQNRLSSLILLHFEREILWTKPFIVISGFLWQEISTPLSTGLLYPKLRAQTSGIIQKLYETKTNTNTGWFKSVNWLFSEIKPKMWDFPRFCGFSAKNGLKCKMTFR